MADLLPVQRFSLGRRVVFKHKDEAPHWGIVECARWERELGTFSYVIACADGTVVRLMEPQLTGFDRLN